jgi:hypothetical protein
MNAIPEPAHYLRLQLLEWIAARPRPYSEVIDAWRTSCPRLSIWEDACIDGLIDCTPDGAHVVTLSSKGRTVLEAGDSPLPSVRGG